MLATGQTTSYGSGAGVDDGALQKGVAKSYTVLTADQYSGTTNITINSKTDAHSNECVVDNNTGLMWSRTVSASVGPTSNGLLSWTTNANGEGIFTYCAAANVALLAGYSDWRIPNIYELFCLYNMQATSSAPDTTAFPVWSSGALVWASTTRPNLTTAAHQAVSGSGSVSTNIKTTTATAALVRG